MTFAATTATTNNIKNLVTIKEYSQLLNKTLFLRVRVLPTKTEEGYTELLLPNGRTAFYNSWHLYFDSVDPDSLERTQAKPYKDLFLVVTLKHGWIRHEGDGRLTVKIRLLNGIETEVTLPSESLVGVRGFYR